LTHEPVTQLCVALQARAQAPQFFGSLWVSVQTPLHSCWFGRQLEVHMLLMQLWLEPQVMLQPPQLKRSERVSTHDWPHWVRPPLQLPTHLFCWHSWFAPQVTLQPPQFFGSEVGSMQAPAQLISPVPQLHRPLVQVSF
jgi:hypothetical protein